MSEDWNRPMIRVSKDQLRDFDAHVAGCNGCRATVIAGWSVSMDVDETLNSLCVDGLVLIASHITEAPEGSQPS